jgi:predicted MFS family arabinose efflux permease
MRAYQTLFSNPGVKRLAIAIIPGRLSYGMIALATFFFVTQSTDSIALAGLATGAEGLASSLTAGFRGSLMDKYGQTKPLSFFIPTWVAAVCLLATTSNETSLLLASALVGLFSPPINLSARPLWRSAVPADSLRTAYALDTTLMNGTIVIGPVVATWLSLSYSGAVALLVTAGLMAIGGLAIVTMPLSRNWIPEPNSGGAFTALRNRKFLLLAVEGGIFGIGWGLLEISIPASATVAGQPQLSAPLLAALSGMSLLGGFILGSRNGKLTPLRGFKISGLVMTFVAAFLPMTTPGLSMALVLGALGFATGFAQVYHWEVVELVRPQGTATSAQAWMWTIEGSMLAIGAAIGGILVEHISAQMALIGVSVSLIGSSAYIWFVLAPAISSADRHLSDAETADALADSEPLL